MWVIQTRPKSWVIYHVEKVDGERLTAIPIVFMTKHDKRLHPVNTPGLVIFNDKSTITEVEEDRLERIVSSRYSLVDLYSMLGNTTHHPTGV